MPSVYREATRKFSFILLFAYALTAVCGFAVGLYSALFGREDHALLVRALLVAEPSVAVLFLRAFLPLGITFLAVRLNCSTMIRILIFAKSALFAFSAGSLFVAYPQAGWLVLLLLMTSDCLTLGIYHWLWIRCLVFRTFSLPVDLWISAVGVLIVFLFEIFCICPFTASLFTKM